MHRVIATVGYEGASLEGFMAVLKRAEVDTVIDVRALPLSRKKGFSKNQLADHLRQQDIAYVHIRALGTPKRGRDAARAGNEPLFKQIFADHMRTAEAQAGLAQAETLVRARRACLLCFEADHTQCHRSIIAGRLARRTHMRVVPLCVAAPGKPTVRTWR